ncbi:MAG TPA: hypothetical protein VGP76_03610 [Planctomycetaceae bacterium]|jgi:hypothetical protein|nr:hypothetical protein [Planctomycetaceae bacterium]
MRTQLATPKQDKTASAAIKTATRVGHVLLIVAVIWMAVSASRLLTFTSGHRSGLSVNKAGPALCDQLPVVAAGALDDGSWQFGELACDVSIQSVASRDLGQSLSTFPSTLPATDRPSTDEADLLRRVKGLMRVLKTGAMQTAYGLETASLKARVFTSVQNGFERIEGGYCAFPTSAGCWTVLVVKPPRVDHTAGSWHDGLLPLPAGAKRICRRFDTRGRLTCEVFSLKRSLNQAPASWQADGWAVKESAWCAQPGFLLHRDQEDIQVIQLSVGGHDAMVIVISVPAVGNPSSI